MRLKRLVTARQVQSGEYIKEWWLGAADYDPATDRWLLLPIPLNKLYGWTLKVYLWLRRDVRKSREAERYAAGYQAGYSAGFDAGETEGIRKMMTIKRAGGAVVPKEN